MISQGIYFHNANSTWLAKKMRECKVSKLQESNFVESQEGITKNTAVKVKLFRRSQFPLEFVPPPLNLIYALGE